MIQRICAYVQRGGITADHRGIIRLPVGERQGDAGRRQEGRLGLAAAGWR
jgi:hypothetical protein